MNITIYILYILYNIYEYNNIYILYILYNIYEYNNIYILYILYNITRMKLRVTLHRVSCSYINVATIIRGST